MAAIWYVFILGGGKTRRQQVAANRSLELFKEKSQRNTMQPTEKGKEIICEALQNFHQRIHTAAGQIRQLQTGPSLNRDPIAALGSHRQIPAATQPV